jgi:hypothetical protein
MNAERGPITDVTIHYGPDNQPEIWMRDRNYRIHILTPAEALGLAQLLTGTANVINGAVASQGGIVPEVCRAHRDPNCKRCDDAVDDLWIHPRDLQEDDQ